MSRAVALSALYAIVLTMPALAEEAKPGDAVAAKADVAKGGAIAQAVCAACHGPDGNATGNAYPKVAGQHVVYLEKQLHDFKAKEGATVPARNNPIMTPIAMALSDTDIRNVAAYYA